MYSHGTSTMDYLYTIIKFLTAGFIIVGVTLIVQHMDPKYGGIIAAAPITTTIAFLFTTFESGQDITRELTLGSFYFAIPTLAFILSLYILLGHVSFFMGISGAYLIWLIGIVIIHRIVFT